MLLSVYNMLNLPLASMVTQKVKFKLSLQIEKLRLTIKILKCLHEGEKTVHVENAYIKKMNNSLDQINGN